MLKFSRKSTGLIFLTVALAGCQTAGTGALDLQGYPNINVVPVGEIQPISPQQEYEMLAKLNTALASQPQLSPNDKALYVAREARLVEIARTHAIDTTKIIEAR